MVTAWPDAKCSITGRGVLVSVEVGVRVCVADCVRTGVEVSATGSGVALFDATTSDTPGVGGRGGLVPNCPQADSKIPSNSHASGFLRLTGGDRLDLGVELAQFFTVNKDFKFATTEAAQHDGGFERLQDGDAGTAFFGK
jgi:hypothetical protein